MSDRESHAQQFDEWGKLAESGSFEAAYEALESAVGLLERGGMPLTDMTTCYELGIRLSKRCASLLRDAELKITQLDQSFQDDAESLAVATTPALFDLNG